MINEPYITLKQLYDKQTIPLGLTKLYELARSGRIPSYRVGGKLLVLESEVWHAIKNRNHLKVVRFK